MNSFSRYAAAALVVASSMTVVPAAHASYFVRPVLQYEGETVDGLILNGATSSSQSFNDGYRNLYSSVDLESGEFKTFLELNGPGTSFGIVTGVMGDTVTYSGTDGPVYLDFSFDGWISALQMGNDGSDISDPYRYIGIEAWLGVYDTSAGATWDDWTSYGTNSHNALLMEHTVLTFNEAEAYFETYVFDTSLSGSVDLVAGRSYNVFAAFNLLLSPGTNIGPVTMDFMNTGTLGIYVPEEGKLTSESGVFLGFEKTVGAVPEPATWAMMILGFGVIGGAMRRRGVANRLSFAAA